MWVNRETLFRSLLDHHDRGISLKDHIRVLPVSDIWVIYNSPRLSVTETRVIYTLIHQVETV